MKCEANQIPPIPPGIQSNFNFIVTPTCNMAKFWFDLSIINPLMPGGNKKVTHKAAGLFN